jgi:hypothetical protein
MIRMLKPGVYEVQTKKPQDFDAPRERPAGSLSDPANPLSALNRVSPLIPSTCRMIRHQLESVTPVVNGCGGSH